VERRAKSRTTLSLLMIFVFLASVTYAFGLLASVRRIPSVGTVKTIGVGAYWDITCTNKVTEIDWGLLEPGETANVTIYLKNEGNAPIALSMSTENWNPSNASKYIALQWSYRGETVNPGKAIEVALVLSVNSTITGVTDFRFDIIIIGTG